MTEPRQRERGRDERHGRCSRDGQEPAVQPLRDRFPKSVGRANRLGDGFSRGGVLRRRLEGLADGTIDCIASDHAPHDQESKRVPFAQAAAGVIGLETLLPVSLEMHHRDEMSLLDLLARLTIAPATLLGLPQGRLAQGAPADLVLFDPERAYKIDVSKFRSKSKNSPFDERPVQGRVLRTIVDGRTVFAAEN